MADICFPVSATPIKVLKAPHGYQLCCTKSNEVGIIFHHSMITSVKERPRDQGYLQGAEYLKLHWKSKGDADVLQLPSGPKMKHATATE